MYDAAHHAEAEAAVGIGGEDYGIACVRVEAVLVVGLVVVEHGHLEVYVGGVGLAYLVVDLHGTLVVASLLVFVGHLYEVCHVGGIFGGEGFELFEG